MKCSLAIRATKFVGNGLCLHGPCYEESPNASCLKTIYFYALSMLKVICSLGFLAALVCLVLLRGCGHNPRSACYFGAPPYAEKPPHALLIGLCAASIFRCKWVFVHVVLPYTNPMTAAINLLDFLVGSCSGPITEVPAKTSKA